MKATYVNHISTPRSFTLVYEEDGQHRSKTFNSNTDEFQEAKEIIADKKRNNSELVEILFGTKLAKATGGESSIKDGKITHKGEVLPPALSERMKQFVKSGQNVAPLEEFWKRLKKNPSDNSRNQLFRYIENHGVTILPDGRFLLYKAVNSNMTSKHDNSTLHVVGEYVTLDRKKCNDDPQSSCSSGLHVAPYKYVTSVYGSGTSQKFVELIIDPEDMVSVPHDQNGQKMRVCRYLVNAIVNMDGVGIRTGLVADIGTKPPSTAEGKAATPNTVDKKPKTTKNKKTGFVRTPATRMAKHKKKVAKKAAKKAGVPKPAKAKLPDDIEIDGTDARISVPGKFLSAAGFAPGDKVVFAASRVNRQLFVFPEGLAHKLCVRHKSDVVGEEVKLSGATALRFSSTLLREAGVKTKKTLVGQCVEINAVSVF